MARKRTPVTPINFGLYLGRSPLEVPLRGLSDGRNFRIRQGRVSNANLGWIPFSEALGTNSATTKALLHFDGPDASTIIREGAAGAPIPYPNWTAAGNAQLDTAQFKFGPSSLLLDGTGDFVTRPDGPELTLGSSNFRIAQWFICNAAGGSVERLSGQGTGVAATHAWHLYRTTGNIFQFQLSNGSALVDLNGVTQFTNAVNTGLHWLEVIRMGNTLYMFIDGVLENSVAFTGTVPDATVTLNVGSTGNDEATDTWTGWIDEFYMDIGGTYTITNHLVQGSPFNRVLNGAVELIEQFKPRGFPEALVVATENDLYKYDIENDLWALITPQYNTATVDVSNANPAVVVDNTGVPNWVTNGIKPGDKIIFQTTGFFTEDANWYEIASVDAEDQLTLTTAVTGTPLTNVGYAIRRVFSGQIRDIWDSEVFVEPNDGVGNDLFFVTNGVDPVATWDGNASTALYRSSLGFKAKQIRVFKSLMVYGNLVMSNGTLRPSTFINSDAGKPLDVVNGLAGQFRVHDGDDSILEMEDLGDNLVIYSDRHITPVQFVGDPLVFVFRQASTGIGPLASRLVADFGDYHELIGADSQYLFDGISVTEVGTQVWREVLRTRDASRQTLGFHHFDEENGDLIWAVPLTSDVGVGNINAPPEEAFVEHYLEIENERIPDPHSRRRMPFLAGGYSNTIETLTWNEIAETWEELTIKWNDSFLFSAFPLNLMGDASGRIYTINVAQFANGTPLPSYVRTGRRPISDSVFKGVVKRIYAYATRLIGLMSITTYVSNSASGVIENDVTNTMDLLLPDEGHFVTPYISGRFAELKFARDDGLLYEIEGYDWDVTPGGRR